jgi:DNA polymerase III delta subunit
LNQQAGRFDNQDYRQVFNHFLATDLALKSSGGDPKMCLERLVFDIAELGKK